jgi:hypothetical protein
MGFPMTIFIFHCGQRVLPAECGQAKSAETRFRLRAHSKVEHLDATLTSRYSTILHHSSLSQSTDLHALRTTQCTD